MRKGKIFSIILLIVMILSSISHITVGATCANGIRNNGLGGIYIDINSAPFTTFAGYSYGNNAYKSEGCAWFASARVNQLTGKGNVIRGALNWWENYASYGFTKGSTPQAGSIICLKGSFEHVAIIEKIEGSTAYISEGGFVSAGASYGYCNIRAIDISQIANTYKRESELSLIGYVYFGGGGPPSAPTECQAGSWDDRVQIQWKTVDNASGYECGLIDINTRNTVVKTNTTDWYHNFYNVPEGQYFAYVSAYNSAGFSSHSNWYRVDVTYSVPGKPAIKLNINSITEGNSVTVSWEAANNAVDYVYYLTEYPEGYAYSTNTMAAHTTNTYITFDKLKNGTYTCFVHSISNKGKWSEQSNLVTFNVYADDYIPTKTVVYNNHIYVLYDYEMSWTFARDLCRDLGGNLVTVTSAEENQVIVDLIKSGSKDAYWIGATDIDTADKDFRWVTGEKFSYSNWMDGEPSSSGTDGEKEHFIEIRKSYGNKWNDVNNISKSNKGFILEVDLSEVSPVAEEMYEDNKYLLFDKNTTWTEARTICEQYKGHLVTIESSDENAFVKELLKNGNRAWYYLGGQKSNDSWKWLDGSCVNNISWADHYTAEWNGTNLMMYKSTGKCIGLHNAYYPESDIKSIGFVCEIEDYYKYDPTPTPSPTPTPAEETKYDGTVTVGSADDLPGGEVIVPVSVKNNPGISSFTFKLNFDKEKLTPVSITKASGLPGSLTSNIQQSGANLANLSYVTAVWSNETNFSGNGELFGVKFKIAEDVPLGENIPIRISYEKGNIIDQNYNDIDVNLTDGVISTAQIKYGDIYKDGAINNKDLVRLRQYLAEWDINLSGDEYRAADVYRDGAVNNKDLVRLSQYLAEWDVKLGE